MYNTEWTATETATMSAPGPFSVAIEGLEPGKEYQYRAVVASPKITMRGDNRRFVAK